MRIESLTCRPPSRFGPIRDTSGRSHGRPWPRWPRSMRGCGVCSLASVESSVPTVGSRSARTRPRMSFAPHAICPRELASNSAFLRTRPMRRAGCRRGWRAGFRVRSWASNLARSKNYRWTSAAATCGSLRIDSSRAKPHPSGWPTVPRRHFAKGRVAACYSLKKAARRQRRLARLMAARGRCFDSTDAGNVARVGASSCLPIRSCSWLARVVAVRRVANNPATEACRRVPSASVRDCGTRRWPSELAESTSPRSFANRHAMRP